MIAKRCENDYRYRRIQDFTVPYHLQDGKTIIGADELMTVLELARRTMSRRVILDPDAEIDVIDSTIPAKMKLVERKARSNDLEVKASRRHQGWGIVRHDELCVVVGNLAIEGEEPLNVTAEPQTKNLALPVTSLKAVLEELLESRLASLPQADRELVEQLFAEQPVIQRLALSPNHTVRIMIVPETDQSPRHIQLCGIVYRRRV